MTSRTKKSPVKLSDEVVVLDPTDPTHEAARKLPLSVLMAIPSANTSKKKGPAARSSQRGSPMQTK